MGGKAFLKDGLLATRIPHALYPGILASVEARLQECYAVVDAPLAGPGKPDHGDLDILVCEPTVPVLQDDNVTVHDIARELGHLLGTVKAMCCTGNKVINFAIPWDRLGHRVGWQISKPRAENAEKPTEGDFKGVEELAYIQVDIHLCSTRQELEWILFRDAHGDLWNILGSIIRPFGLTLNHRGFYIRIPELEQENKKRAMILLTCQADEVLEFFGLSGDEYWSPFETVQQMFAYVASCRLFGVVSDTIIADAPRKSPAIAPSEPAEHQLSADLQTLTISGADIGKRKHSDRVKAAKRPVFMQWLSEHSSARRASASVGNASISRDNVREEALARFPAARQVYEDVERVWRLERHTDRIFKQTIKGNVPIDNVDPALRAASIRMLKRIVMEQESDGETIPGAANRDEQGYWCETAVQDFVVNNWERLGQVGLVRQQARAAEACQAKALKRAQSTSVDESSEAR